MIKNQYARRNGKYHENAFHFKFVKGESLHIPADFVDIKGWFVSQIGTFKVFCRVELR